MRKITLIQDGENWFVERDGRLIGPVTVGLKIPSSDYEVLASVSIENLKAVSIENLKAEGELAELFDLDK